MIKYKQFQFNPPQEKNFSSLNPSRFRLPNDLSLLIVITKRIFLHFSQCQDFDTMTKAIDCPFHTPSTTVKLPIFVQKLGGFRMKA